jgi:hypothetical protein
MKIEVQWRRAEEAGLSGEEEVGARVQKEWSIGLREGERESTRAAEEEVKRRG